MSPRKLASVLMRALIMRTAPKISAWLVFSNNPRLAHLFMICSNIKLTGPAESTGIGTSRDSPAKSGGFNAFHHPRQQHRFQWLAKGRAGAGAKRREAVRCDMGGARQRTPVARTTYGRSSVSTTTRQLQRIGKIR